MACCAVAAYVIMRMISVHGTIKAQTEKITTGLEIERTESCRIKISGITCPACVEAIESALSTTPGLKNIKISQLLSQALIEYTPKDVMVEEIVSKIEDLGYGAERIVAVQDWVSDIREAGEERARSIEEWRIALYGSGTLTLLILASGLFQARLGIYLDSGTRLLFEAVLCAVVIAIFGRQIHYEAFLALRSRRSDMSLLTSMGIVLSFFGSLTDIITGNHTDSTSFESTAILSCVAVGGRFLKSVVMRQSTSSVSSLASLITETAEVLTGSSKEDGSVTIGIDKLQIGDRVVVSPGDIIPVDGKVLDGCGNIGESHVTGEILPILRSKGNHVFAGSVNHDTHLVIETTRVGQLTWLQHTLHLMAEGDAKKASIQGLGDFIAARFALIILAVSVFMFAKTSWVESARWAKAFHKVTAILLCACPCALSLASPTAVMIGLGLASKRGILLKGGSQSIEAAAHTRTILFDKTGTLTTGKISVVRAEPAPHWGSSTDLSLLWWLALLTTEEQSKHPVARAIVVEARQNLTRLQKMSTLDDVVVGIKVVSFKSILGLGVMCDLQLPPHLDKTCKVLRVLIGSRDFLESRAIEGIPPTDGEDIQHMPSKNTLHYSDGMDSFIAFNNVYAGWIKAADEVRPEAPAMVRLLRSRGYRIGMMTGGTALAAHSVAQAVGIHPDWVYFGLLPKEKSRLITKIRAQYGTVAMVGDNLNDVQSMNAADFSVAAFVDIGSLTAITSDSLLLDDGISSPSPHALVGLSKVPYLFELSTKIYGKIWQNLLWAIIYNSLAVAAGIGIFESFGITLSPVYAGLGMSLSSVFVITNAMNLEKGVSLN